MSTRDRTRVVVVREHRVAEGRIEHPRDAAAQPAVEAALGRRVPAERKVGEPRQVAADPAGHVGRHQHECTRCLVQQLPGAPLREARAFVDGVGQVPQPRARGLVERGGGDGLQVVFMRKLTSH